MRLRLLLSAFCLLLSSCASPVDRRSAAPQLIYLDLAETRLVSRPDLASPSFPLPYSIPADCAVYHLHPNPVEPILAAELLCSNLARVALYDLQSGAATVPVEDADSRFLAWSTDGEYLYLRRDTLGNNNILRYEVGKGRLLALPFPSTTYDLAALPDGGVLYSLTQGIGYGSEVWLAHGNLTRRVFVAPLHIVAYLRPSPDGSRAAFILFPDSQTPFPNGELWLMNADGSRPRRLAAADAGHGYAPAWSPDGTQIAFIVRENADDPQVQTSADALVSNLYRVEVGSGALFAVTHFTDAIVETPVWSPDGKMLAFNVIENGTIQAWVYSLADAALSPLGNLSSCCAVWLPGR